ncbi:hypothetical protein DBR37_16080 [Herminiimonas sp. KBW02]|uniref:hypothetical protein n=1 Tax=Herminiimonas sp. KBW02 TaxID=2153363 RepID=UPI000F59C5F0|nr:hypothetical protein [Herminiimonas sp. KBW02]RQO32819.1 hypothetical protein DBR37_16080 [Herminiimonas sp. KBW02]
MSNDPFYLQLAQINEPYIWRLSDGEMLTNGLSDAQGRVIVLRKAMRQDYVLEMLWGQFPVSVPTACWKLTPAQFIRCVRIGPREDTAEELARKQADRSRREENTRIKEDGVAWVTATLSAAEAQTLLQDTLEAQNNWRKTPAGALNAANFNCRPPAVPSITPVAEAAFENARNTPRNRARPAYTEAARLGHWRAAARLASGLLDDEDWESASMVIAWLLKHEVPAGYNKLADLLAVTGRYEDGQMSPSEHSIELSLRWRAAQLGDPVAQMTIANHLEKAGNKEFARTLQACAKAHNPEL